jgi:hypothetical protein
MVSTGWGKPGGGPLGEAGGGVSAAAREESPAARDAAISVLRSNSNGLALVLKPRRSVHILKRAPNRIVRP